MIRHGIGNRHPSALSLAPGANKEPGLFGKMFGGLPALAASDAALLELANAMRDTGVESGDNPDVPAGFTYLGQFVDHDITFDPTPLGDKIADPLALRNFRSPRLDLDSLYGLGPDVSPYLYMRANAAPFKVTPRLAVGITVASPRIIRPEQVPAGPHDLFRSKEGQALIGDPRNDENLVIAQLHLAFVKFHNTVVDGLAGTVPSDKLFEAARRLVVWHYQWIILHEFLEKLTGEPGITARILHEGRKFYRFRKHPFMPVEFSAAAYRLGHSMIRDLYSHNAIFSPGAVPFPAATLKQLFDFTAKSGEIVGDLAPPAVPLPQPVLPSNWAIDWRRFFELGPLPNQPGFIFNHARLLDPFLANTLHTLPGEEGNNLVLPFRNLKRGVMLGLPSGQAVARHMKKRVLTPAEFATGTPDSPVAATHGFDRETPLWYYILKEAQVLGNGGRHLGPVGATIVAEVLIGLVAGDPDSYLSATPAFRPTLGPNPGSFTMADLINTVGDIDPVGP